MSELSEFLQRAEALIARLEVLLPAVQPPLDWNASIAFRWRKAGELFGGLRASLADLLPLLCANRSIGLVRLVRRLRLRPVMLEQLHRDLRKTRQIRILLPAVPLAGPFFPSSWQRLLSRACPRASPAGRTLEHHESGTQPERYSRLE
jgi:hypothetical protein